jgi:alkylhydroperoxidase family enzyme
VVGAVLDDWRTAPVGEPLRATLGLLERLTLEPESVRREHVEEVLRAGASVEAIDDALHVCALFDVIDRIADALGFANPGPAYFAEAAPAFLERGYLPER